MSRSQTPEVQTDRGSPTPTDDDGIVELALWIDGKQVPGSGQEVIRSVDPSTGRVWATIAEASGKDVDDAVAAARRALDGSWGAMSGAQRAQVLRRIAVLIDGHAGRLATIESRDNGKLLRETTSVVANLPRWFNWFAGAAERLSGTVKPTQSPDHFVYTYREPVGVVAGIVPWNSPLVLLTMKLAPVLAAGCTAVFKTAEQTTASALELMEVLKEAGVPDGVVNVITGDGQTVGRTLVRHPGVDKVSFTGSTQSGIRVMEDAASHLAPVTLELGGKSANVVFADADVDAAVNGVVAAVFAAAGQMCIAGGRLLVERSIHDEFVQRVADRARSIRLGDPCDAVTEMGPLASAEQRERVLSKIAEAVAEGAHLECGGGTPSHLHGGYFVEPTVFTNVTNDMDIAQQEVFGPVLTVIPFDSEEEAVAIANDSEYGLAGGVWTNDLQRALRMSRAIKAGTIWVNTYRVQDASVPFGGLKRSGVGHENGDEALQALTTIKSVWMETSGVSRDPFIPG